MNSLHTLWQLAVLDGHLAGLGRERPSAADAAEFLSQAVDTFRRLGISYDETAAAALGQSHDGESVTRA